MGIKDVSAAKFSSSVMQEGRQMFRTSENLEVICSKIAIVLATWQSDLGTQPEAAPCFRSL